MRNRVVEKRSTLDSTRHSLSGETFGKDAAGTALLCVKRSPAPFQKWVSQRHECAVQKEWGPVFPGQKTNKATD